MAPLACELQQRRTLTTNPCPMFRVFRFSAGSPNGPLNPKTLTARSTGLGSAEGGKVARSSRPPITILESKLAANATQGIAKEASRGKISPHHPPSRHHQSPIGLHPRRAPSCEHVLQRAADSPRSALASRVHRNGPDINGDQRQRLPQDTRTEQHAESGQCHGPN